MTPEQNSASLVILGTLKGSRTLVTIRGDEGIQAERRGTVLHGMGIAQSLLALQSKTRRVFWGLLSRGREMNLH